jgi:uncharacterized protein (TIGR00369 family)
MREINPEHLQALMALVNDAPYFKLLGMRLCELGAGYSRVEVELCDKHLNPFGGVHGGVYSSVIDTAAYWAVYCGLDEGVGWTTIDLNVDNLAMSKDGLLVCEGKVIKAGKTLCLAEATLKSEDGRIVAHGTSKLMVLDGKQSIEDVTRAAGHEGLPPKFI